MNRHQLTSQKLFGKTPIVTAGICAALKDARVVIARFCISLTNCFAVGTGKAFELSVRRVLPKRELVWIEMGASRALHAAAELTTSRGPGIHTVIEAGHISLSLALFCGGS